MVPNMSQKKALQAGAALFKVSFYAKRSECWCELLKCPCQIDQFRLLNDWLVSGGFVLHRRKMYMVKIWLENLACTVRILRPKLNIDTIKCHETYFSSQWIIM